MCTSATHLSAELERLPVCTNLIAWYSLHSQRFHQAMRQLALRCMFWTMHR
jgi:hypothetical protein